MEIFFTSILAFASTNIDDLFILTLFFGNKSFKSAEIFAGQILGISSLIAISLVGSLAGLVVDPAYIGLLGLVPIYLGLKAAWSLFKNEPGVELGDKLNKTEGRANVLTVAGVTIANGGDNIGIYVPLFAAMDWMDRSVIITVFLVMTITWCFAAKYLTKHPYVAEALDKYGHLVTPVVLVLLGIYILYESGSFGLLN
jgi:cadmium resistance protein CadD (predicted permease)